MAIFRSSRSAWPWARPRHRDEELAQLVAVGGDTELVEQGLDAGIEVMVTGTAGAGPWRRGGQRERGSVTGRPFPGGGRATMEKAVSRLHLTL